MTTNKRIVLSSDHAAIDLRLAVALRRCASLASAPAYLSILMLTHGKSTC